MDIIEYEMTPEQTTAFAALNDAEQRFALTLLGGGTTRDAMVAGWGDVKGSRSVSRATAVRNRPHVRHFMTLMQLELVSDMLMSRTEAMERLSAIARASVEDVLEIKQVNWGTDDNPDITTTWQIKDDPDALGAIAKVSSGPAGPRIEMYSALAAIKQLSDMCGWDMPKHEIKTIRTEDKRPIDVTQLSNETLHELVLNHYATSDNE